MKKLVVCYVILLLPCLALGQDISTGLVGYWPLDGNAIDAKPTGTKYHGVLKNGATPTLDRHNVSNGAIRFDGIDDFIEVLDYQCPATAFTYSFWFMPATTITETDPFTDIIYGKRGARPHFTFNWKNQYKGQLAVALVDTDIKVAEAATPAINSWPANTWYHFVATWDGTTLTTYVNGQLQDTQPADLSTIDQEGMTIGARPLSSYASFFNGAMDDIRVYDRALAPVDIDALYHEAPVYEGKITRLALYDARNNNELMTLSDTTLIDVGVLGTDSFTIRAFTDPSEVGSVVMELTGGIHHSQVSSNSPYDLFGNNGGSSFPLGIYTLSATPYSLSDGNGLAGEQRQVQLRVVNEANALGQGQWAGSTDTTKLIYRPGAVAVGIDSIPDGFQLAVKGKVVSEGYVARFAADWPWPDYVFEKQYQLLPLEKVEAYIQLHKHLPDVPSEADVKANGVSLEKMDAALLKKVEELTLYLIQMEKENRELRNKQKQMELKINQLLEKTER
ncbi:MAG: LamG domain-containing protein [Flammeovirgaceae bacterium]